MDTLKKHAKLEKPIQELNSDSTFEELKESRNVENTPFSAHRYDTFWILTCGRYRTMDKYKSFEDVKNALTNPSWEILTIMVQGLIDFNNENQKNK